MHARSDRRESLEIRAVAGRRIACAELDVGSSALVLFCHGFRDERTGPNRTFVRTGRALARAGISSLRFDQYGSGDSDGDFSESRFDDRVELAGALARREHDRGRTVGLLGQSMGATAALCAAAEAPAAAAVVARVPDANVDPFAPNPAGWSEDGQRVDDEFWRQAHAAGAAGHLAAIGGPALLVFGTSDEYVSAENRASLVAASGPAVEIDVHEGWSHSGWSWDEAALVIDRSTAFLAEHLVRPSR